MASLAEDPAQIVLAVDRARHDVRTSLTFDALVEAGTQRWRSVRPALAAAGEAPLSPTALRSAWNRALRMVGHHGIGRPDSAAAAHLAACWLRREEIDTRAARPVREGETAT
ncbi:hypothetical protein F0344_34805 (plasmid) [Streptomyces finlayi]|uniref:Uncharacterized protein n=1 Tax=Streptomyces finlayi TaxID=67296 RepID=A0A7G7BWB6_9ACTN|nr:DUF6187 family protein [Streptomyces finlayi]QNE79631.1 hypothetical protein F0344_34805 [Streptomyces finlayi]